MPIIPFLTTNIAVSHTVHSDAFTECPNSLLRRLRKFCFNSFDVTPVAISEASSNSFEEAYGSVGQDLIYNGRNFPEKTDNFESVQQEIDHKKNNGDTKVFVHIGRLQVEKNQQMMVRAFNRLVYEDDANAILFIIGGGRNDKIQQTLTHAEKEHKHIHVLGERHHATDYLHAADFFCLSSIYEGMPITLIETFATKTIPICTPVGGIPEMIEDLDESLLSDSIDEDDYYDALKRVYLLEEESKVEFKKRAGAIFKKKYSMKYCAEKYVNLYRELIDKN